MQLRHMLLPRLRGPNFDEDQEIYYKNVLLNRCPAPTEIELILKYLVTILLQIFVENNVLEKNTVRWKMVFANVPACIVFIFRI